MNSTRDWNFIQLHSRSHVQRREHFLTSTDQSTTIMAESLRFLGSLAGHNGWVTAIATSSENPDMILTASRGTFHSFRVEV